ncbi:unnamed protein product [Acanthoscelides obtectus]|uniref:Uncharacterized protein n=1 Tax=Acanthoscelides obtectus TaxID=200917 RepID=A0A9P0JWR2_ACAOB|nr:unnamed protein product [Acanthoscelides obtectus]CAK1647894.1 hypothetical protein AOBTE_LOCUS15444 [Acanthoscelides obtectus]
MLKSGEVDDEKFPIGVSPEFSIKSFTVMSPVRPKDGSSAENGKLREAIKGDPVRYEVKKKESERYHARKAAGKIDGVAQMSEREERLKKLLHHLHVSNYFKTYLTKLKIRILHRVLPSNPLQVGSQISGRKTFVFPERDDIAYIDVSDIQIALGCPDFNEKTNEDVFSDSLDYSNLYEDPIIIIAFIS